MTDLKKTLTVAAKRLSANYRISAADADRTITRALQSAPDGINHVEAIYWFTAGWMAGRGRDSNAAVTAAPGDES